MIHLAVLALAAAGFLSLCAANPRHQRDLTGRTFFSRQARAVRWSGWAALAVALVVAVTGLGAAHGVLVWTGALSLGAALAIGLLAARTPKSRRSR